MWSENLFCIPKDRIYKTKSYFTGSLAEVYDIDHIIGGDAGLSNAGRQNILQKNRKSILKNLRIGCKINYITSIKPNSNEKPTIHSTKAQQHNVCAVPTETALILLLLREAQDGALDEPIQSFTPLTQKDKDF